MDLPSIEDIDRELALRDLAEFSRQAWAVLEPSTPLEWNWHLDALCQHVQAVLEDWIAVVKAQAAGEDIPAQRMQNLIVNVPPGTGKSRFVSVFAPAWMWLKWPSWRAIFISGNPRISLRDADLCRILLESKWYRDTFKPAWTLAKDQNAKSLYRNTAGGFRMATSAGSRITGDRGDALFVDDPNDAAEVGSEVIREGINDWWDKGAANRVNDLRYSPRFIIQQRLHEKDLTGHLLSKGGFVHMVIQQEFEPGYSRPTPLGWSDPRTNPGELMFPTRFPVEVLAREKVQLGPTGYAGQHQQRPAPAGGGRFKSEWFRYAQIAGAYLRLFNKDGTLRKSYTLDECDRFGMMDPAGTDKHVNEKACYSSLSAYLVTPCGCMVMVDHRREQMEAPDVAEAGEKMFRLNELPWFGVEKNGLGLGVVQTMKRRGVPVKPILAKGSKEARSETAEIRFAAGMIYFLKDALWLPELERELLLFPNGEYADQVDELSHAARHVHKAKGAPTERLDDIRRAAEDELSTEAEAAEALEERKAKHTEAELAFVNGDD